MMELDPNLTGLGIGAVVLAFVFRRLWRQDASWPGWLASAKHAAEQARTDAAIARAEALASRESESECRRRLSALELAVEQLKAELRRKS